MSADIAQDLKTPLNRLQMRLEAAAVKTTRGETVAGVLDEAHARATCGSTPPSRRCCALPRSKPAPARRVSLPVALREVVLAIAEAYVDVVAEDGKTLLVECRRRTTRAFRADRQLLLQMCSNLVENAMAHCPAGTTIRLEPGGLAEAAAR